MKPLPAVRGFTGKPASNCVSLDLWNARLIREWWFAAIVWWRRFAAGVNGNAAAVCGRTTAVAIAPGFEFESLLEFSD